MQDFTPFRESSENTFSALSIFCRLARLAPSSTSCCACVISWVRIPSFFVFRVYLRDSRHLNFFCAVPQAVEECEMGPPLTMSPVREMDPLSLYLPLESQPNFDQSREGLEVRALT